MTTMQIQPDDFPKSGYQLRPPAPPSAGRALSVLIAVCAVLWVWLMLPWWLAGTDEWNKQQWLWEALYSLWSSVLLSFSSSLAVFYWAIKPLWQPDKKGTEGATRLIVLWLCLSFQAILLLSWLCILAINLDNSVWSSSV
jgi:hypothetical protein